MYKIKCPDQPKSALGRYFHIDRQIPMAEANGEEQPRWNFVWKAKSTQSRSSRGGIQSGKLGELHVDKEKDTTSEIPELFLLDYILQDKSDGGSSSLYSRRDCHLNVTSNSASQPNSNLDLLKSALKNRLQEVSVYSNPLPIRTPLERYSVRNAFKIPSLPSLSDVAIHAFVVFRTVDTTDGSNKINWWSIEKNGRYIILQQSPSIKEVSESVYDVERRKTVRRLGPVKELTRANVNNTWLKGLFESIWETEQLNQPYHLFTSNCQIFASFVFEKVNDEGKKWSTLISGIVDSFGNKKETIRPVIDANTIKYHWIVQDSKYLIYKALIENEHLSEFQELLANYGTESINERDSQGYTLLEWAQAFTRGDVKMHLLEKGAVESELIHRNVFFIALQYWNSKKQINDNLKECLELDYTDVNETGDTALHLALHGAKWQIAKRILSENYANSVNSLGEIPLHIAAKSKGKMGLFKKILNQTKSESVDKVDKDGFTPLHWATFVNPLRNDKIKLLLDKGANINAQDTSDGNTPLHFALMLQSITVTEILLKYISTNVGDKVLDVNIKNNDEQTALHWAAAWPDIPVDLFKLILGKYTDINAQDNNKDTPLHAALMGKSKTATKKLLKHDAVDVNTGNIRKKTATHFAAEWPDIPDKLFKLILEKSVDINATTDCGASNCGNCQCHLTPLHMALGTKSAVATRELLKHVKLLDGKYVEDVDVNAKDNHEQTALYLAAMWAQIPIELFTIILNKSTDINAKSKCENTPLSVALWNKSETATRQLLQHVKWVDGKNFKDVDVNIKNGEGDTALHRAAQWTDIPGDLFKWILQKSTNVNAQNKHGTTPLHFALWNKSKTATEELLKCDNLDSNTKGFNNATALHLATSWPDIPRHCFRTILEKTADINATNIHGETPLLLALRGKSVIASEELLGRLLLKGQVSCISAEINLIGTTRNEYDVTALHCAASWPDIPEDIFKKVLDQSIDINAKTKCGATPLHSALFNKSKTATEQLLKHVKCVDGREMEDVDVNIKGFKSDAALHVAVQWSDIPLDFLKSILEKTTDINASNDDGETPLKLADICKLNKEAFKLLQHRSTSLILLCNKESEYND
ncbi:hypothetical protein DAPPUDRAFT_320614 [Daphnia pulex]|uniref:Uncharacterized protein n=1 Tax=Daphnia pulex TaxID=6669 RepID=E9GQM4_DAPPU|nr:hypothetical protein DAPPUDRAFT_320614 [Daphnia pulex]|eukprot:EFX78135.1 hypothetical protein DAPPUDRAFT_320614 [Daphnia pulex]